MVLSRLKSPLMIVFELLSVAVFLFWEQLEHDQVEGYVQQLVAGR